MQEINQVATAIDLRMRQLEAQGIKGAALADPMFGYMAGLQRIYDTASDEMLADLCHRYPGFHRYANLMEAVSEQNQKMLEAGTHPYDDLPLLSAPLKHSLEELMASAVELERSFQSAVDSGRFADHASELTASKNRWADDLKRLVHMFQSSDVPLRGQSVVQQTRSSGQWPNGSAASVKVGDAVKPEGPDRFFWVRPRVTFKCDARGV